MSSIQYDWNTSLFPLIFWWVKQNISKGINEDWYGGKEQELSAFLKLVRGGSRPLKEFFQRKSKTISTTAFFYFLFVFFGDNDRSQESSCMFANHSSLWNTCFARLTRNKARDLCEIHDLSLVVSFIIIFPYLCPVCLFLYRDTSCSP